MNTLTDHLTKAVAHADALAKPSTAPTTQAIDPRVLTAEEIIAEDPRHHVVLRDDVHFPQPFRDHAPEIAMLFVYGNLDAYKNLLKGPSYAIVGARRASAYGREVAYSLSNELAAAGARTISGMALGIDGASARGSLQGGTPPVAFLAGPASEPYPRSHRLLHEQITRAGCAISITPPGILAQRESFRYRSKLIGLLADSTVFVEGSENSGAIHTIAGAETAHHEVFAVPGPVTGPMSTGPNACIATGRAHVARSIEDLNVGAPPDSTAPSPSFNVLTPRDRQVYDLITQGIRTPREILEHTDDADGRAIATSLGTLELQGFVNRHDNGNYSTLR